MIPSYYIITVVCLIPIIHFRSAQGLRFLPKKDTYKNPFVGFYIFPHGGIILSPQEVDYSDQPGYTEGSKEKMIRLNEACQKAAEDLIESKPDLIILSTPHGFHLEDKIVILNSPTTSGEAGPGSKKFHASFDIDQDLSIILYLELHTIKDQVELLGFGVNSQTVPILWSEVIPFHFIINAAKKANYPVPPVIYLGQPPLVNSSNQVNLGRDIVKAGILRKEMRDKRIVVVVSGDLSHLHGNDSVPGVPPSPYPFDPISATFDELVVKWAQSNLNESSIKESTRLLTEKIGFIERMAGHCGYTGFLMLQGMFQEVVHQGWHYDSRFYAYECPTYFGMMVHGWRNEDKSKP